MECLFRVRKQTVDFTDQMTHANCNHIFRLNYSVVSNLKQSPSDDMVEAALLILNQFVPVISPL